MARSASVKIVGIYTQLILACWSVYLIKQCLSLIMNSVGYMLVGLNQFEIQEIKDTELIDLRVLQKECFKITTMKTSSKMISTYLRMYGW